MINLKKVRNLKSDMCEYFFLYNIANGKNRTSNNKENNDKEDSKGEGSKTRNCEAESESVLDIDVDILGMSYSCNIIILN
jgi:hypothetical protein